MLDIDIFNLYQKNNFSFIKSYTNEIEKRYKNFKASKELDRYQEVLSIWQDLLHENKELSFENLINLIRTTEKIGYIYPDAVFKIEENQKSIKKITSKFSLLKSHYWMTPDPLSFPEETDIRSISLINVFWFLVGRPVNFDLLIYKQAFPSLLEKSNTLCDFKWDENLLYEEIFFMDRTQFGDFLMKNKNCFYKILTDREINFSNRFNRK